FDLLPNAFYENLKPEVRFGANVHAIEQDKDSVTVRFKTESGRFAETGDYAVCGIPFSILRDVEVTPSWSREKQKAIRELNYNPSTKILFQTKTRFWEKTDGIVGGTTATDLPIRRIGYQSHADPDEPRGTLLASYTWGQDALRWGGMDEETRLEEALEDVAKVHPEIREEYEVGATYAWYNDRWARGAFALFEPEQETRLQRHIVQPEGRVRFAGEHCSLWHAWIQGALESGIRAAKEIHEEPAA
ncbi:MAG: flavin monoamine oxidase family protein, partial [Actinomycetota bacterium]